MAQLDLVVFDWDGTLMDSEAAIVSCMQAAIGEMALTGRSDANIRGIIGLGLKEAIHQLYPELGVVAQAQLAEGYRRNFMALGDSSQTLFPGVEALLDQIASIGIEMAVATGKSRRGLDKVLADTGLGGYFLTTRTVDECRSKPDPQMLLEVMELAGAAAGQTLMVGDSIHDVRMAANAGVAALGVGYGVHPPELLIAEGAISCIDEIGLVIDYIGMTKGQMENS